MPRQLLGGFLKDLHGGFLKPFVEECQADDTLLFAIRKNYFNIYYRGGSLVRIGWNGRSYDARFDLNYLNIKSATHGPNKLPYLKAMIDGLPKTLGESQPDGVKKWIDAFPYLKYTMDIWYGDNRREERELQQLMVRENNRMGAANASDYFITDIEFASRAGGANMRADMVALHWPSTGAARSSGENIGLAFIEMKYAEGALIGNAGLKKHLQDIDNLVKPSKQLTDLKEMFKIQANQLSSLGLLHISRDIKSFSDAKPELILVLSNHDPASKRLQRALEDLPKCENIEVKFMVANFTGYGIFSESLYSPDEFRGNFAKQIYNGD